MWLARDTVVSKDIHPLGGDSLGRDIDKETDNRLTVSGPVQSSLRAQRRRWPKDTAGQKNLRGKYYLNQDLKNKKKEEGQRWDIFQKKKKFHKCMHYFTEHRNSPC